MPDPKLKMVSVWFVSSFDKVCHSVSVHFYFHCTYIYIFVTLPYILRIYVVMLIIIVDDTGEYVDNWNELTTMLNNTLGPKKSIEDWKMVS